MPASCTNSCRSFSTWEARSFCRLLSSSLSVCMGQQYRETQARATSCWRCVLAHECSPGVVVAWLLASSFFCRMRGGLSKDQQEGYSRQQSPHEKVGYNSLKTQRINWQQVWGQSHLGAGQSLALCRD